MRAARLFDLHPRQILVRGQASRRPAPVTVMVWDESRPGWRAVSTETTTAPTTTTTETTTTEATQ